jgi:peptidyl-prolyl cis-trans isomerase C
MVLDAALMKSRSALVLATLLGLSACDEKAVVQDAKKPPAGLTRQQASAVLARVGDKTITVGDFAAALERLDDIDRLRFQTPEKRKELLGQMIDLELLAEEARRRGLDKDPSVELGVRQILRDAMLAKAREGMVGPAEIPASEVSAYYEAHRKDFEEPERRRVAAIVLADAAIADEVAAKAAKLESAAKWGELYFEKSVDAPKVRDPQAPLDLAGDLGLVGNGEDPRARNERVPAEVQRAAFAIEKVGEVHPKAVRAGDRFYVVRLTGMAKGHVRSLSEAERAIRVAILQERIREREAKLEAELRQRFAVKVDDAALSAVALPTAPGSEAASPAPSASSSDRPASSSQP